MAMGPPGALRMKWKLAGVTCHYAEVRCTTPRSHKWHRASLRLNRASKRVVNTVALVRRPVFTICDEVSD